MQDKSNWGNWRGMTFTQGTGKPCASRMLHTCARTHKHTECTHTHTAKGPLMAIPWLLSYAVSARHVLNNLSRNPLKICEYFICPDLLSNNLWWTQQSTSCKSYPRLSQMKQTLKTADSAYCMWRNKAGFHSTIYRNTQIGTSRHYNILHFCEVHIFPICYHRYNNKTNSDVKWLPCKTSIQFI